MWILLLYVLISTNSMKYNQSQTFFLIPKSGCYSIQPQNYSSIGDIQLPLKYFSYDVNITDSISEVKMIQKYINNTNKNIQIQYIFPIYPNSTITSLQISFSDKKSKAIVMGKQQASAKYSQYQDHGWGVGLAQYRMSSQDTMKIIIGNINANQQILVQLEYIHNNPLAVNGIYQYTLASTMTPRYVDRYEPAQLQFGSMPNSKVIQGNCNWSVSIRVKSQNKIAKIQSPTHKIKSKKQSDKQSTIQFDQTYKPNKDFMLYYAFQKFQEPTVAIFDQDNRSSAVVTFLPKLFNVSHDDALKKAKENKDFEMDLDASKGEFIFILDRSGSMDGIRIQNAKAALQIFLRSLPEDSYFNVVSFGTNHKFLFPNSVKNSREALQQAIQNILKMQANMGGTEILEPIKILMTKEVIKGYPRQLFLLTDGAITDVLTVMKFVSKHTQYTRVNTIGVGYGCSKELIIGCAKQGKGYHIFIDDDDKQPQKKIIQMLQNSMSPLISDMKLQYDESVVQSIVPNPKKIPYLLKNDLANFYINFNGKLTKDFVLKISYKDSRNKQYSKIIKIDPKNSNANNSWVQKIVNAQKLRALCDSYHFDEQKQDRIFYVKNNNLNKQKLLQQIVKQSIRCQILTEFTSLLCVDHQKADQIVKQNLKNPKQNIQIAQMNPIDHFMKAKFTSDHARALDDNDGQYVDQCCVLSYQGPNMALQQLSREKQQPKRYKSMQMIMKVAANPQSNYLMREGITNFANPQKKVAFSYIIKKQQTNGSWLEDFLESLFPNALEMKKRFKAIASESCYITFLVAQFLMRFYRQSTQYSLIIKKAQNYVQKNSQGGWSELERVFHSQFYKPLPSK